MKNINIDKMNKKFKLNKNGLAKKVLVLATTGIMALGALTGCANKEAKNESTSENVVSTVETTESTTESTEETTEVTYAYTQEMWNAFVEEAWTSVEGKINNIDRESFESALMTLNIDFLNENNPSILREYYGKGIDSENELNKLYAVISQIREYNTSITKTADVYSLSNLLIEEKDKAAMEVLESLIKEIMVLSRDLNNADNVARINEIFEVVSVYSKGESKIRVNINGQEMDLAQIDLSKGGVVCSEVNMQIISVLCQPVVDYEQRAELDNSLRTRDVLAKIQEIMITNNAIASVTNSQVSTEEQAEILSTVNGMININIEELSTYGVTADEARSLFVVANIDYFVNSTNSANVFATLYADGFDINKTFTEAESAVMKIEAYNVTVSAEEAYNYGHLFIENRTDIISVRAIVANNAAIRSTDANVSAQALQTLKAYNQYSSQATVSYSEINAEGNVEEATMTLDKNALSKGGNQLVDWIEYYTLLYNRELINNEQFYGDMTALVDGTQTGLSPYNDIVLMVDGFCAENNIVVYNYETGKVK